MTTDLDQLLRDANPSPQPAVDRVDLAATPDALREAILATSPTADDRAAANATRRRRRWPLLAAASLVVAVATVFVVASVDRLDRVSPSPGAAWAAEAVRAAREVPRLLPTEPGWHISYADEAFDGDYGSVQLANGNRSIELTWAPLDQFPRHFKARQNGATRLDDGVVDGEPAAFYRYNQARDDLFAMWRTDKHYLQVRVRPDIPDEWKHRPMPAGEGGPTFVTHFDEASFRRLITSLTTASVDTWLSSMPSSVVKPGESRAAVDRMLEDVPTPAGFDPGRLVDESATRETYHLGAKVTGSVSCAWLRQWRRAIRVGDTDGRDAAITAMDSARHWKILQTMAADGQYPEMIWEYAAQMRAESPAGAQPDFDSRLGCLGSNAPPR